MNKIVLKQLNDDQIWPEINTMINAVPRFTLMNKHYTDNRVQAMVKFDMIDKAKNNFPEGDKYMILIVLDNKHKFLGMKLREGQVEYFGKNGTSLLGSV